MKIGWSSTPEKRLEKMQVGCPHKLQIVLKIPCKSEMHSKFVEAKAHQLFKKARKRGEWFTFKQEEKMKFNELKKNIDLISAERRI